MPHKRGRDKDEPDSKTDQSQNATDPDAALPSTDDAAGTDAQDGTAGGSGAPQPAVEVRALKLHVNSGEVLERLAPKKLTQRLLVACT